VAREVPLKLASYGTRKRRVANDRNGRRHIEVNTEFGAVAALGRDQAIEIYIRFADLGIEAGNVDAVAVRRGWSAPAK
jgi:hypothetical protein